MINIYRSTNNPETSSSHDGPLRPAGDIAVAAPTQEQEEANCIPTASFTVVLMHDEAIPGPDDVAPATANIGGQDVDENIGLLKSTDAIAAAQADEDLSRQIAANVLQDFFLRSF